MFIETVVEKSRSHVTNVRAITETSWDETWCRGWFFECKLSALILKLRVSWVSQCWKCVDSQSWNFPLFTFFLHMTGNLKAGIVHDFWFANLLYFIWQFPVNRFILDRLGIFAFFPGFKRSFWFCHCSSHLI